CARERYYGGFAYW
nr:immunoglobulin heavy chain junction region [Mus musculus]